MTLIIIFGIAVIACLLKYGVEQTMIFSGVFTGLLGVILTYYFTTKEKTEIIKEKKELNASLKSSSDLIAKSQYVLSKSSDQFKQSQEEIEKLRKQLKVLQADPDAPSPETD